MPVIDGVCAVLSLWKLLRSEASAHGFQTWACGRALSSPAALLIDLSLCTMTWPPLHAQLPVLFWNLAHHSEPSSSGGRTPGLTAGCGIILCVLPSSTGPRAMSSALWVLPSSALWQFPLLWVLLLSCHDVTCKQICQIEKGHLNQSSPL